MFLHHFFEDVPNFLALLLDHLLGGLDGRDVAVLRELIVNERLEELESHHFGQTALMKLQFRTDDDNGTTRVVDAFSEQVLAETALLALEHVGQANAAGACSDR